MAMLVQCCTCKKDIDEDEAFFCYVEECVTSVGEGSAYCEEHTNHDRLHRE